MILKYLTRIHFYIMVTAFTVQAASAKCPDVKNADGHCTLIQNHLIFSQIRGTAGPVVVFEAGLGGTLDTWNLVVSQTSKFARTITYDRTNLGNSESNPDLKGSITAEYVVHTLKVLLEKEKLPPPYILVGHSDGGLYMQLFARKYPKLTSALILVDSVSPYQTISSPLPPVNSPEYQEALGFETSKKQVSHAMPFPPINVIVLTASYHGSTDSKKRLNLLVDGKPEVITAGEDQIIWERLQNQLAKLSPKTIHLYVYDSDHAIQKYQPSIITDAIYTAIKNKGS